MLFRRAEVVERCYLKPRKGLTQHHGLQLCCGVEHLGSTRRPHHTAAGTGFHCWTSLPLNSWHSPEDGGVQMLQQDDEDRLTLTGG